MSGRRLRLFVEKVADQGECCEFVSSEFHHQEAYTQWELRLLPKLGGFQKLLLFLAVYRNKCMNVLLDLFLTFARIGLFTFGGGYAMISLIGHFCVEVKRWITHDELVNVTVIAESTPGPIAINCATFVGYKQKGLAGAVTATIGVILPSFCYLSYFHVPGSFSGNCMDSSCFYGDQDCGRHIDC